MQSSMMDKKFIYCTLCLNLSIIIFLQMNFKIIKVQLLVYKTCTREYIMKPSDNKSGPAPGLNINKDDEDMLKQNHMTLSYLVFPSTNVYYLLYS